MHVVRASALLLATLVACGTIVESSAGTFSADYDRLLVSYATFKKYRNMNSAADVEKTLKPDRLNTVRGILRGTQVEIAKGRPLIGYIKEVRGIWGVRLANDKGAEQFRLSVVFDPSLKDALSSSANFDWSIGAHVLLPVQEGGDDDPDFVDFTSSPQAETWRQKANASPRLQICMSSDARTGELDIDFDIFNCHLMPANSDIGSIGPQHKHLSMLNKAFAFPPDLALPCQDSKGHCLSHYSTPYCK
jgi:hypothetical protein